MGHCSKRDFSYYSVHCVATRAQIKIKKRIRQTGTWLSSIEKGPEPEGVNLMHMCSVSGRWWLTKANTSVREPKVGMLRVGGQAFLLPWAAGQQAQMPPPSIQREQIGNQYGQHHPILGRRERESLVEGWKPCHSSLSRMGSGQRASHHRAQGMYLCNDHNGTHISHCGNWSSSIAPPFKHLQKKVLIFSARFPPKMGGGVELGVAGLEEISSWPLYLFDSSNYFLFLSHLEWSSITQQIVSE